MQAVSFQALSLSLVQSLDPLPMRGRDLGVNPDDFVETPEVEQEAKQEILENKDVSMVAALVLWWLLSNLKIVFTIMTSFKNAKPHWPLTFERLETVIAGDSSLQATLQLYFVDGIIVLIFVHSVSPAPYVGADISNAFMSFQNDLQKQMYEIMNESFKTFKNAYLL